MCFSVFTGASLFVLGLVILSFVYFLFDILSGCQYQCNQLLGKTRLQNDLLCVAQILNPT